MNKIFFLGDAQRKVILINPKFQLNLINSIVLLYMFVVLNFYIVIKYVLDNITENALTLGIAPDSEYIQLITGVTTQINIYFMSSALVTLLIIYYFGLRMSHSIAGPIFKINKSLDEMLETKQKVNISLRTGDHFQETAIKINQVLKRVGDIQEASDTETNEDLEVPAIPDAPVEEN
jgi:hypothetical protein